MTIKGSRFRLGLAASVSAVCLASTWACTNGTSSSEQVRRTEQADTLETLWSAVRDYSQEKITQAAGWLVGNFVHDVENACYNRCINTWLGGTTNADGTADDATCSDIAYCENLCPGTSKNLDPCGTADGGTDADASGGGTSGGTAQWQLQSAADSAAWIDGNAANRAIQNEIEGLMAALTLYAGAGEFLAEGSINVVEMFNATCEVKKLWAGSGEPSEDPEDPNWAWSESGFTDWVEDQFGEWKKLDLDPAF